MRAQQLPHKEKLNFSELVENLSQEQSIRCEKGISLDYNVEKNIFVNGNYNLLSSLIENLITNAYRYGKENGHISVELINNENNIRLSVSDDGIGIAPEMQDKIFNRFYRGDSSRTSSDSNFGLGLGLPMARRIAQLHNGSLTLEKSDSNGSVFVFEMPFENNQ